MTTAVLAEVCEINPKPSRLPTQHELISFLPMAEVTEEGTTTEGSQRPFSEVRSGYTLFERGDVLVAKITPCFENGKIAQACPETDVAAGSTEFHVVRPLPGVADARYVLHLLRHPHVRLAGERRMTGSGGQRRVPASFLAEMAIPLPPLAEQKRIAAILDKADELQAKRRAAIAHLDSLTQAIFLDMFGDPLTNPKGWPVMSLSDLIVSIDSGKSPVCLDRPAAEEEWAILKLGSVSTGKFDESANKALRDGVEPDLRHEVRDGDVLISRKNTPALVGACVVAHDPRSRLLLPDLIFRLVCPSDGPLGPLVLAETLRSPRFNRAVRSLATGAAASMVNISKAKLLRVQVPVPRQELQAAFLNRAAAARKASALASRADAEIGALCDSLATRAFRGEL